MSATSRTLEHVGEWQVELEAESLEEVFAELAKVVARSMGIAEGPTAPWEPVEVRARDVGTLLADWANELLGRSETTGSAYGLVRNVRVHENARGHAGLTAEIAGQPLVEWASPLKAATYHDLRIERRNGRWHAVLLFDV